MSYVVLASLAGARKKIGEREEVIVEAVHGRPEGRRTLPWIPGLVALAALAACRAMALRGMLGERADYAANLAWFKQWLIVPTLVYFISATAFQVRRKRIIPDAAP